MSAFDPYRYRVAQADPYAIYDWRGDHISVVIADGRADDIIVNLYTDGKVVVPREKNEVEFAHMLGNLRLITQMRPGKQTLIEATTFYLKSLNQEAPQEKP